MVWVLGILLAATVITLVLAFVRRPEKSRSAELRKRYAIDEASALRIPLAEPQDKTPSPSPLAEIPADGSGGSSRTGVSNWLADRAREAAPLDPRPPKSGVGGTIVTTPEGETVVTTPPFALRHQVLSSRLGRFVNGLGKRLPAWMVACPRVRLEALVIPTPPDGRDADDWSQWRRRVRLRAVDVVVCDRRTWKPVLAIMLKPAGRFGRSDGTNGQLTALTVGGGRDRMIDEVLTHVGLTLVHASGRIADDWPLISPYIEQAILRSPTDEEMFAADQTRSRPEPDAAVNLLKMDADKGWLLE